MQTIVMELNVLLSGQIFVILSSLAIIDATILLTNIDISKSFNGSSFPQGFIFVTSFISLPGTTRIISVKRNYRDNF
jgi:hypothetical protein